MLKVLCLYTILIITTRVNDLIEICIKITPKTSIQQNLKT
jgi:hypothetical protein